MIRLATYLLFLAFVMPLNGMTQQLDQAGSDSAPEAKYISIGLLIPDLSHKDLVASAELAIEQANAAGGYKNREFRLQVRTTEGFWGAGSKESVGLVYEDGVCAIIGSLDGRNGHLAEQVAAKSQLTYIETYATEPTLSQAFVPWFMRVVPNDNQQASVLVAQIESEGGGKTGILSARDYDARYAVKSLTTALAGKTGKTPLLIEVDSEILPQNEIIDKILDSHLDHLVIPFDTDYMESLIKGLGKECPDLRIYGTLHLAMGMENREPAWDSLEGMYMLNGQFDRAKHPVLPNKRSAYVYDAVSMVIHAIYQVGTGREPIAEYLLKSVHSEGSTGSISFDKMGNRLDAATLIQIREGRPQLVKLP